MNQYLILRRKDRLDRGPKTRHEPEWDVIAQVDRSEEVDRRCTDNDTEYIVIDLNPTQAADAEHLGNKAYIIEHFKIEKKKVPV